MSGRIPRAPDADGNVPSPTESEESAAAYLRYTLGDRADEVMRVSVLFGAKLANLERPSAEDARRVQEKADDLAADIERLTHTTLGPYMGEHLTKLSTGLSQLADVLKERPSKISSEGDSELDLHEVLAADRRVGFAVLVGGLFQDVAPVYHEKEPLQLTPTQLLAAAVYAGIVAERGSESLLRQSWMKLGPRAARIRDNMVRFGMETIERQEALAKQAARIAALRARRRDKPDGGNESG